MSLTPEQFLKKVIAERIAKLPADIQNASAWSVKTTAFVADRRPGTIRRWIDEGKFAYTRIGGTLLIDRADFLDYILAVVRRES